MKTAKHAILFAIILVLLIPAWADEKTPLKLVQATPLPELHDGDFDHFAVDLQGNRLFSTAEENSKVLVFDLKSNKLIHTIEGLKAPHSMVYRADLKKLFVVDGDSGDVRMYETGSYKPAGTIKVREGADSSTYDPMSKYLYIVDTGKDAHLPDSYITIVDTTSAKKVGEIKINSDDVEAITLEKSGPRLFVDIRGKGEVQVYDRNRHALLATWPLGEVAKKPTTIALDEPDHRLFVGTRDPGKLVVLDTDSGKVVTSYAAASMSDDMVYSPAQKRIYFAGSEFVDVFEQRDSNHYEKIGHVPTAFRAKTAILVPELNRYYVAVPHHENQSAELRVYEVVK
ncbi:MAG: YncE family protein [Acidobacteria bacterium]|nr:YncE family protein [Acidobacteriota bacterium]